MAHARDNRGFTAIEILVSMVLVGLILAGVLRMFSSHSGIFAQQAVTVDVEQNLRAAMELLTEQMALSGGYLAATADVSRWVPWVPGFTANPTIAGTPTKVSIMTMTPAPVAYVNKRETSKQTKIELRSAIAGTSLSDVIDTNTKRLIVFGDEQAAIVRSATATEVTIDTDPVAAGNQGLLRSYPQDTPVFRVDVSTYSIELDPVSRRPQLRVNYNQGGGSVPVAEGISAMQIEALTAGRTYRVTLTGTSDIPDPRTGTPVSRTRSSTVAIRNALDDLLASVDVTDIGDDDDDDDPDEDIDGDEIVVPIPPHVPPPPEGW